LPSKEERVARQSFDSSVIITIGNLSSLFFLLIASFVVARLLGPQEYGLYSLALALPLFLQLLVGFGVNTAIYRFSAYHLARGEIATAQRMTKNAILFYVLSGSSLTALTLALSGPISSYLFNRPGIILYVEISSILILGQALFNLLTPAFVGWRSPFQDALWTVTQAVLKLTISVSLILLGFGIIGALYGYILASLLAGIFGILVLYFTKLRMRAIPHEKVQTSHSSFWNFGEFGADVRKMIGYGFPVYTGNVILQFSQQPVLTIIISYIAANAIIGYYSAASNITQGIATISAALVPAFYTAFASLEGMGSDTKIAFRYAVKYVSYFMMPLVMFMAATPSYLIEILYGRAYINSAYFLEVLTLSYLPYAFGYTVLIPFLNGTGNTKYFLIMNTLEALATLVSAFILIFWLKLGVDGLLYAILISNIAPTAFGLYSAQKYLKTRLDYESLFKTFLVSIASFLLVYLISISTLRGVSYLIGFPLDLLIFLALFLTLMPLSHAIQIEDIDRLRQSTRGIKILRDLLDLILNYEQLLIERTKTI
jgi:O-antigen/teichoic acid export membrane protein